ncbi:MAG: phosphoglucosamine mutase [Candidatus Baldrarchaeia archaeon]
MPKLEEIEHIFRAYDIRGIYNKELTPEIVARIGQAFGTLLEEGNSVSICRDVRTSSPAIEHALTASLTSTGVNVTLLGELPISVGNWATWKAKTFNAGIIITASHNPPEYNGIRFRHPDGTGYIDIENQKIKKVFYDGNFRLANWNKLGKVEHWNTNEIIDEYVSFVLERIPAEGKLKVVLDPGNGVATHVAPKLFKEAGFDVITINEKPDGTFSGRSPDPLEDPLTQLRETVVREKADLGIAYDGDGDRAIFVDDKGRKLLTEKVGLLLVRRILSERKGATIVVNASCSMIVDEEVKRLGGKIVRSRVGDVFVSRVVKEHNAALGIEMSAHFFLPTLGFYFDDAIAASFMITAELEKTGEKLSTLMDQIPSYPLKRTNIECPDHIKFQVIQKLIERFRSEGYDIDTTDGVRVNLENGWIIMRPSNTEPKIRVTAEARTDEELEKIFSKFVKNLRDLIINISK